LVALSSLCAGDGLADVAGRRWGKGALGALPWSGGKTLAGSLARLLWRQLGGERGDGGVPEGKVAAEFTQQGEVLGRAEVGEAGVQSKDMLQRHLMAALPQVGRPKQRATHQGQGQPHHNSTCGSLHDCIAHCALQELVYVPGAEGGVKVG